MNNEHLVQSRNKVERHFAGKTCNKVYRVRIGEYDIQRFKKVRTSRYWSFSEWEKSV